MSTQRSTGSGLFRPVMAVLFFALTAAGCTVGNVPAPTGGTTPSGVTGTAATPIQVNVSQVAVDAQKAGDTVADLQTKYGTYAPGSAGVSGNATALDKFFVADAKNARVPWLSISSAKVAWTLAPVTYTSTDLIDVLWLGKSDSGEVLAWATATYRADIKQFGHVVWGITDRAQNLVDGQKPKENPFPVTLTKSEPGPKTLDKDLKGKDDAVATSLLSDATTWNTFKEYTAGRDKMQSVYGMKATDPFLTTFMPPPVEVADKSGKKYNQIDALNLNMRFVSVSTHVAQINDGAYGYFGLLAVQTASADKKANVTSYDVVTYLVDASNHVIQIAIRPVSPSGLNTAGK